METDKTITFILRKKLNSFIKLTHSICVKIFIQTGLKKASTIIKFLINHANVPQASVAIRDLQMLVFYAKMFIF